MKKTFLLILIGLLWITAYGNPVGVANGPTQPLKDLVLLSRSYHDQLLKANLPFLNDKVPSGILLLLNKNQEKTLSQKKFEFKVIAQNFKPSAETWFINSQDVCSPCFTNVVGSFAKILWKSETQFLVVAEAQKIRYILNNQDGKVAAYNLGPEQTVLYAAPAETNTPVAK